MLSVVARGAEGKEGSPSATQAANAPFESPSRDLANDEWGIPASLSNAMRGVSNEDKTPVLHRLLRIPHLRN